MLRRSFEITRDPSFQRSIRPCFIHCLHRNWCFCSYAMRHRNPLWWNHQTLCSRRMGCTSLPSWSLPKPGWLHHWWNEERIQVLVPCRIHRNLLRDQHWWVCFGRKQCLWPTRRLLRWSGQHFLLRIWKQDWFGYGNRYWEAMHPFGSLFGETILRNPIKKLEHVFAMLRWEQMDCQQMRWYALLGPGIENLHHWTANQKDRCLQNVPMQKWWYMRGPRKQQLSMHMQARIHWCSLRRTHRFLLGQTMWPRKMCVSPRWLQLYVPR